MSAILTTGPRYHNNYNYLVFLHIFRQVAGWSPPGPARFLIQTFVQKIKNNNVDPPSNFIVLIFYPISNILFTFLNENILTNVYFLFFMQLFLFVNTIEIFLCVFHNEFHV